MDNYALIIGINDYHTGGILHTLSGAINDAREMRDWVITQGNVPNDADHLHIILSTSDPYTPIRNDIDIAVAAILQHVTTNGGIANRLYFYFAGHGMGVDVDTENNALCMSNWNDMLRSTASLFSKGTRQKFVSEGLFREVVLWMDCCRSTKMFLAAAGENIVPGLGPETRPKWFQAYAAQYQDQAFEAANIGEGRGEPRGIFTKVLLEGLKGAAGDPGTITSDQLRDYLCYNVPVVAKAAGFNQMPDIAAGNIGGPNQLLF